MRALISHLILPVPIYFILLAIALIISIRRKKIGKLLLILSFIWLLLVSTPFIPDLLIQNLENQYSVISEETLINIKDPVNILILGGGHIDDENLPANSQLVEISLARLTEGIRVFQQLPNSRLITSGYGGINSTSNAQVMANTALILGVDSLRIYIQENPQNTGQEASSYKQKFGNSIPLILVTSAAHMPRAMYLLKKAGLNPIAAPTNFLVKKGTKNPPYYWLPSSEHIEKTESAIHEYVGILWYRLGGK